MIVRENVNVVKDLAKHLVDVNFDSPSVTKSFVSSKNTKDILDMQFYSIIETFHSDLASNETFSEKFTDFNNSIVSIHDFQICYGKLCDEFNLDNIELNNKCYMLDRELKTILAKKINTGDPQQFDDYDDYITKLDVALYEIEEKTSNSLLKYAYINVKNIACDILPDYIDIRFIHTLDELIATLGLIEKNVADFKLQIENYIKMIKKSNTTIEDFVSTIRVEKPKKWQFWKYFSNN